MFPSKLIVATLASLALGPVSAFRGDAESYEPDLGACGQQNSADDSVAALSSSKYDDGERCFKEIKVFYGDKSVVAKVVDKCSGCASNDITLSTAAFNTLADPSATRIKVDWIFL